MTLAALVERVEPFPLTGNEGTTQTETLKTAMKENRMLKLLGIVVVIVHAPSMGY
jgi:hypothetical protein